MITKLVEKCINIDEFIRLMFFISINTFIFKIVLSLNCFFTILFTVFFSILCLFIDGYITKSYYYALNETFNDKNSANY